MKKHLISFGAAVVAAFVCWLFTDVIPSNEQRVVATFLALFIGGAVHLIVLMFLDRNESSGFFAELKSFQERAAAETTARLAALETAETTIKSQVTDLLQTAGQRLDRGEKLSYLFNYQGRRLDSAEIRKIWFDLLTGLQERYYATNYIDPKRIYKTDWGAAALLMQNAKKMAYKENVIMKKVFFIDHDSEMATLSEHLDEQRRIGVNIQYFPVRMLDSDPGLSEKKKSLGIESVDFGVLDSDAVLVWKVNHKREIEGGRVLVGNEYVKNYRTFFECLYRTAEDLNHEVFILIEVQEEDKTAIRSLIAHWPSYKAPYEEMDYALRPPKGWLWNFGAKPSSKLYAAFYEGCFIGFSILVCDCAGGAEIYVALHPDQIGKEKRLGFKVTEQTVRKGFEELKLNRIYLKVRQAPEKRVRLYEEIGFSRDGTKIEETNGKSVEFLLMEMKAPSRAYA